MNVRRAIKRLAFGALVGTMALTALPSRASGTSPVIPDALTDVVDFLKHTQNSFRPSQQPFPSPYTAYQRACKPDSLAQIGNNTADACGPFDIAASQVASDSTLQRFTFKMWTRNAIPPRGAPITVVPAPFTGLNYAWYFATTTQEAPHVIGISCSGAADANGQIKDDFTVEGVNPGERIGAEIVYTPNATCPSASNADKESKGQADGSKNVLSRTNVLNPIRPASDGWLVFAEVALTQSAHGAKRLDGQGNLVCQNNPQTGQPYPVCIDYDMSLGQYEGYSGVSTSNSLLDFDAITQPKLTFNIVGNTIVATVPWNPTVISGTDGDGLVDDARSFPWVLGTVGGKITQFVAETTGVVGVGANTVTQVGSVCPDSTDNLVPDSAEPIRTVGATEGSVNRAVGDATGFYVHGNGGTDHGDCIRGITGLLTFLDWTGNGAELRLYPRNPGYLPNTTSTNGLQCRYPIGEHPGAIVLLANLTLDPMDDISVGVNTSPFDKPYTVKVYANSVTPTHTQPGTTVPPVGPVNSGLLGKDVKCGYTYWAPGIHYFDTFADIPM